MLEAVVPGVSVCPRCEGIWVTAHTLDLAFGNPRWPESHAMWWHNELACPECLFDGATTIMDARSANGVHLDRCPTHGLWLDRGELGRVMATGSDELAELLRRIEATVDIDQLANRRQRWQSELHTREQAASEAMAAHARAESERTEQRRASEQQQTVAAGQALERDRRDRAARDRVAREDLNARRHAATSTVARLEAKLAGLRAELEQRTDELATARRELASLDEQTR
jgi:Zn-finger nucleic acid-binding protein